MAQANGKAARGGPQTPPVPEPAESDLLERAREIWIAKRSVLRFVGIAAFLVGLFYLFTETQSFQTYLGVPVTRLNAVVGGAVLRVFGQPVMTHGDTISNRSFSISIHRGCDALEPFMLFAAAIIAFPAPPVRKVVGILSGALALGLLNLVRIVSLFLIGIYWHDMFDIAHVQIWEGVFVLLTATLTILWMRWAAHERLPAENPAGNEPKPR